MTSKYKVSIAEQIKAAQIAISNALIDTEIADALAEFGYTIKKIQEGQVLLDVALVEIAARKAAFGTYRKSTADMRRANLIARDAYQALAKVVRASFTREHLVVLGLNRREPRSVAAFLIGAYIMFDNALTKPGMLEALQEYGYDRVRLTEGKALVAALDKANQELHAAKGAAKQSTQEQDKAMKELYDWYARFIKIARVALRDKKQLLEKLGVPVRASRTAAHRTAKTRSGHVSEETAAVESS
ncbi:hypothetical protein JXQ70_17420 [bacterium]|nr:hypothetical protein [bacterium]